MRFGLSSAATEAGLNGRTGALFEGLEVPADSAAALKRSMPGGAPRVQGSVPNRRASSQLSPHSCSRSLLIRGRQV